MSIFCIILIPLVLSTTLSTDLASALSAGWSEVGLAEFQTAVQPFVGSGAAKINCSDCASYPAPATVMVEYLKYFTEARKLKIGLIDTFEPFTFADGTGIFPSIVPLILEKVRTHYSLSAAIPHEFVILRTTGNWFDEIASQLANHAADIFYAGSWKQARTSTVDYSCFLWESFRSFIVSDTFVFPANETLLNTNTTKCAYVDGSASFSWANSAWPGMTYVKASNFTHCGDLVKDGFADICATIYPFATNYASKCGNSCSKPANCTYLGDNCVAFKPAPFIHNTLQFQIPVPVPTASGSILASFLFVLLFILSL